jgi:hypothetical protein
MAIDTLVGDVEPIEIAIEQLPQGAPAEMLERLGIPSKGQRGALHARCLT